MFEADKDLVYLDYGAVSIVEKTGKASTPSTSSSTSAQNAEKTEGGNPDKKSGGLSSFQKKKDDDIPSAEYMSQVGAWDIRQFGDASHIPGMGVAML